MTTPIQGQQFDPEEEQLLEGIIEHWRKVWNEAPGQAITRIEDAAKQMIVVTTGLQGLYVGVIALSNVRTQVMEMLGGGTGIAVLLLFFTPLMCWLISLFCATHVFVPRVQPGVNFNEVNAGAWQKVKDAYRRASEEKLRWLHRSHRWLITSFLILLVAVLLFLFLPGAPAGPTQIIIVTPTPVIAPTSTN